MKDKTTGFLFESGNVEDLTQQIYKANEISEVAYKIMSDNAVLYANQEFSSEVHYQKLMEIYQDVLNK